MKVKLFFAACLAAVCSLSACAMSDGKESYDVGKDFRELKIAGAVAVEYSAAADAVTVIADEEVLPYVKVVRRGGDLDIYVDKDRWKLKGSDVRVIVPVSASLESVKVAGASSFRSESAMAAANMEVTVAGASVFVADIRAKGEVEIDCVGASSIKTDVRAKTLAADVTGASRARISGHVEDAEIDVTGASSLSENDGRRLETDFADVSVTGASKVKIHCNKAVSGSATGASSLKYSGNAKSSIRAVGASSVSNR